MMMSCTSIGASVQVDEGNYTLYLWVQIMSILHSIMPFAFALAICLTSFVFFFFICILSCLLRSAFCHRLLFKSFCDEKRSFNAIRTLDAAQHLALNLIYFPSQLYAFFLKNFINEREISYANAFWL